jgi:hypothetical protein
VFITFRLTGTRLPGNVLHGFILGDVLACLANHDNLNHKNFVNTRGDELPKEQLTNSDS